MSGLVCVICLIPWWLMGLMSWCLHNRVAHIAWRNTYIGPSLRGFHLWPNNIILCAKTKASCVGNQASFRMSYRTLYIFSCSLTSCQVGLTTGFSSGLSSSRCTVFIYMQIRINCQSTTFLILCVCVKRCIRRALFQNMISINPKIEFAMSL